MLHWCHTLKVLKHRSGVSQNAWDVKTGITTRKNCCLSFLSDQNSSVQTSNVWKMPPQTSKWPDEFAYYGPFPDDIRTINIRLPTPQQQPVAGGVFSSIGRNSSKFMTAIQNADSGSLLFSDDFLLTWMSLCHCTSALKTFQKGTHS